MIEQLAEMNEEERRKSKKLSDKYQAKLSQLKQDHEMEINNLKQQYHTENESLQAKLQQFSDISGSEEQFMEHDDMIEYQNLKEDASTGRLKQLKIPSTINCIGESDFLSCTSLVTIHIPKSVVKLMKMPLLHAARLPKSKYHQLSHK